MIVGFGVIVLAIIGAVGASLAAPFAVAIGGVLGADGNRGGRLAVGLRAWVALTTAAIVGMCLGLTGNAGSGMLVLGTPIEDLLALAPWALLLAASMAIGFFVAARRRAGDDE